MQSHGPKRIYTPQAVEFWFDVLEKDWEAAFQPDQLEMGRGIYKRGEIREIELHEGNGIIHRKVEKKDEYAVLEWKEGALQVRSSSSDPVVAHAIAVAGLHEIEELVADEIIQPQAPATAKPAGQPVPAPASARPAARPPANGNGNGGGAGRPLLLALKPSAGGLACEAFWAGSDSSRTPALGQGSTHSEERAKIIGLAAQARRAHFHYDHAGHRYVLEGLQDIPEFLRNILPLWRRHFLVEEDPGCACLVEGPRQVEVEGVVEAGRGDSGSGALNLRWIFRAGERLLSRDEVKALARNDGAPVLLPGIGIVSIDPAQWQSVARWGNGRGPDGSVRLEPYLVFSLFSDRTLRLSLAPAVEAWRRRTLGPADGIADLPDFLRAYQRRGVEWMWHLASSGCHGLLADEMGLGKTVQAATLIVRRPLPEMRHLVVCPASVVPVWREELARFFPGLQIEVLKAGHDFATHPGPTLWLASYAQLRKHRPLLDGAEFGYAILDEGQFIKNPDAKVTQACFSLRARHRYVLTGTPLENRQLDLWSIFHYLLPGLLGTRASFEAALAADRAGAMERLRAQVTPFLLRRTKNEVARELPQKVEMDLLCPLTVLQQQEYVRVCREGLARLGPDIGAALREKSFGFLSLLTRLRQICCDPDLLPWLEAGHEESGKLNLLVEKLAEILASGHKVVIFSQFVMLLKRVREVLERHFAEIPRFEITGVTLDRLKPVQAFQGAAGPAVMLVSLKAAGTGITLHAADYVFLLDPWWNPAVEDQAVDRVHRIGQTNTVFVYRMVTSGTIEERIQALKATKREVFRQVVDQAAGDFEIGRHFSSLNSLIELAAAEVTEPETPAGAGNGHGNGNGTDAK